jgi:hypothetical protein
MSEDNRIPTFLSNVPMPPWKTATTFVWNATNPHGMVHLFVYHCTLPAFCLRILFLSYMFSIQSHRLLHWTFKNPNILASTSFVCQFWLVRDRDVCLVALTCSLEADHKKNETATNVKNDQTRRNQKIAVGGIKLMDAIAHIDCKRCSKNFCDMCKCSWDCFKTSCQKN